MAEPSSDWDGENLIELFLRNEVSNHKPRATTGKVGVRKQGTVMTVQSTELLPSVFEKLSTEGFLSAPVCIDKELVGQVSLLDIVKHVNSQFFGTTESDWVDFFDKKLMFQTTPVSFIMNEPSEYDRAPYTCMERNFTSFSALELMGRQKNQSVLLVDDKKDLCGILTQSMLISFLRQNKPKWGEAFKNIKVEDFIAAPGYKHKKLQTIGETELAINAFLKMEEQDVHGLPIVDNHGVLTGCISVRDLRGVGTDGAKFYRLFRTVKSFKDLTRTEHDQLAPSTHYSRAHVPGAGVYVTPDETMEDVIRKMNDGNLHRIFICSAKSAQEGRPVPTGVISLSDVLYNTLEFMITSSSGGAPTTPTRPVAERARARKVSPGYRETYREPTEQKASPARRTLSPAKPARTSPGIRSIPIL